MEEERPPKTTYPSTIAAERKMLAVSDQPRSSSKTSAIAYMFMPESRIMKRANRMELNPRVASL
jgi:hypothetical protein